MSSMVIRPSFTLGGWGGGIVTVNNPENLSQIGKAVYNCINKGYTVRLVSKGDYSSFDNLKIDTVQYLEDSQCMLITCIE